MMVFVILLLVAGVIIGMFAFLNFAPQLGAKQKGDRLKKLRKSENFIQGRFRNLVETPMNSLDSSRLRTLKEYYTKSRDRMPTAPIQTEKFDPRILNHASNEGLVITWLGHSTVLIELDGYLFLTDPVFSRRPSPIPFVGPKAFDGISPIEARDFPRLDAIIISHDHYDHLDYKTILQLHPWTERFFAPLGVGAHLERWGVPPEKIVESDWWEEMDFHSDMQLIASPSRHFSGRKVSEMHKTLWASWIIKSPNHSIFFGGDSGYSPVFREIGQKHGPFDLTMLDSGQYSVYWPNIHMMPEQTVQAHLDLKGDVLMPIHWGKFNLSLHPWTEPIERIVKEANDRNVELATPKIGESFAPGGNLTFTRWWKT